MPFIGKNPTSGFSTIVKDDLTADGSTTAFTLSKQVASANDVAVFVGNVRQEPTDAYSVSGTTLTMTAAPASGINFYVLHIAGTLESSVVPADDTISTTKIQNDAVTSAKMDTNIALDGTLTLNGAAAQTTYAIQTQTKSVYLSSTDTTYSNLTVKKGSATTTDYIQLRDESNNLDFKIDSVGRLIKPNNPFFEVQTVPNGLTAGQVVDFTGITSNVGGHWDNTQNRFTAPVAGYYQFNFTMFTARTTSTGDYYWDLRKNGGTIIRAYDAKDGSVSRHCQVMGSGAMYLAVNDYVDLYYHVGPTGMEASGNHNRFSGYLIG